jgi:tRNA pseudouridine38-40 synthase
MRIALGIEYDGRNFCGWQTQPSRCSAQDALERALTEIAGHDVATICAGRTDAGVHALGQVVHFDSPADRRESAWIRGTNALLPSGLAVTWMRPVPLEFNARYSAFERRYRYILLNHPVRPAANHGRVGWYHAPLDLGSMREAASVLLGEHDFSAFRSSECQAKSPVRELRCLDVHASRDYVIFELAANGFLHHMVRNIVGSLIYVGNGRQDPEWLARVLSSRDRALAAPTVDAAGLYLEHVSYDAKWGLPQRNRSAWPYEKT